MMYEISLDKGYSLFMALLFCFIAYKDYKEHLIDDIMIICGLLIVAIYGYFKYGLLDVAQGAIAGGGINLLIFYISKKVYGEEAYGSGDVTLMTLIGAFLGWQDYFVYFLFTFVMFLIYVPLLFLDVKGLPLAPHFVVCLGFFRWFELNIKLYQLGTFIGDLEYRLYENGIGF